MVLGGLGLQGLGIRAKGLRDSGFRGRALGFPALGARGVEFTSTSGLRVLATEGLGGLGGSGFRV